MSDFWSRPWLEFDRNKLETVQATKTLLLTDVLPKVSIVIPALNEAKNLPHVLPCIPEWMHEVILIPGHSTDNTVEVAKALCPTIRVVEQHGRGKGAALRSGFAAVTGDIIVMLDADGSMSPATIPAFVGVLVSGADFVKGSRFIQGGGTADMEFYRRFGNWGLTFLVNVIFGGTFSDLCYGYNAFWTRLLPELNLDADGFEIETQMNVRALRLGLKVAEIPNFEASRIHGVSNLSTFWDGWRVLKTILKEWSRSLVEDRQRRQSRPALDGGEVCEVAEPAPALLVEPTEEPLRERAVNE